jgi:carbonic anhydrase
LSCDSSQPHSEYVKDFKGTIKFKEMPDQKALVILTCMDPRSEVRDFWKTPFGPAIFRNAGGRATPDVLRSLRILASTMANGRNTLGAVAVIHHTDCGLINFDKQYLDQKLMERVGEDGKLVEQIKHMNHYDFNE